mgnify:CR=1 FL=1
MHVCQNGYVVRDIRAAMDHWVNVMGVGPLVLYRSGQDRLLPPRLLGSAVEMSVRARQFRRSPDRTDPAAKRRALDVQGVSRLSAAKAYAAYVVLDPRLSGPPDRALSAQWVGHEGQIGGEEAALLFRHAGSSGTVVEISDISGSKGSFFEHIRKVAAGWNGADPIRDVGGR